MSLTPVRILLSKIGDSNYNFLFWERNISSWEETTKELHTLKHAPMSHTSILFFQWYVFVRVHGYTHLYIPLPTPSLSLAPSATKDSILTKLTTEVQ